MNSVMPLTGTPRLRASSECASSWNSTLAKNSSDAMTPIVTRSRGVSVFTPRSGPAGSPIEYATSAKMKIQLRLTVISMPKILPIRTVTLRRAR